MGLRHSSKTTEYPSHRSCLCDVPSDGQQYLNRVGLVRCQDLHQFDLYIYGDFVELVQVKQLTLQLLESRVRLDETASLELSVCVECRERLRVSIDCLIEKRGNRYGMKDVPRCGDWINFFWQVLTAVTVSRARALLCLGALESFAHSGLENNGPHQLKQGALVLHVDDPGRVKQLL